MYVVFVLGLLTGAKVKIKNFETVLLHLQVFKSNERIRAKFEIQG